MNHRFAFGWVALGFVLALGCGSNTDDTGGVAGATGGGGTTAGGGSGSGSGAGIGGVAGTTAGSGAGAGGALGTGNGPDCPASAPMDNAACTVVDTACTYGVQQCSCDMAGGGAMLEWNCGFGGGMQMCPATAPSAGAACQPARGTCSFGAASTCDCVNDTSTWACWDPADCPTNKPVSDSACPTVGMQCRYGQNGGGFGGRRNGCVCAASGWVCSGDMNQEDAGM